MPLKFHNYLSKKKEEFKPIGQTVGLYTCGPTVYDFAHIGNFKTYIFEDILRRVLEFNNLKVKQVMNITDIDDKIIKAAHDRNQKTSEFVKPYEEAFFKDLEKLNILKADVYPCATDHINSIIRIIEKLIDKGFAYKAEDGVYFSVLKFSKYGKLSGLSQKNLKKGVRIDADLYDKENWSDFALWKFPSTSSGQAKNYKEPSWPAPFGEGRPGWHIECSAMAMKYLGETVDIHAGAVDLLFPHHENEIAQSEAATGKKFVNFWLEGEHLLVEGEKMAKSLGNIFTLADLEEKGFDPLAFRYLVLGAHYRSKLNFTWKSLEGAQNGLNNLRFEVSNIKNNGKTDEKSREKFREALDDDLDTPKALKILWEVVRSDLSSDVKKATIFEFDQVLGLGLEKVQQAKLPKGAESLIDEREKLRKTGKFAESDKIREKLNKMGVEIEDTPKGPKWKIK